MAVTMKDIARMADVSSTVVCSVLGGRSTCHVSQEKRRLILELVKRYDYQPNAQARGLRLGRTKTIGILMANFRDRVMAELSMGLYRYFLSKGYASNIAVWESVQEIEQAYVNCIRSNVDGIVTCDWHPEWMTASKPVVVYGQTAADADSLTMDYDAGLAQAMEYLCGLGHRKLAYLGPKSPRSLSAKNTAQRMNIPLQIIDAKTTDRDYGCLCMHKLLTSRNHPSAVICHNDTIALAAMAEAQRMGFTVGRDVSVIGFDNIPEASTCYPGLTTIDTFVAGKASMMASMLLKRIKTPDLPFQKTVMKTELVIRESCGERDER